MSVWPDLILDIIRHLLMLSLIFNPTSEQICDLTFDWITKSFALVWVFPSAAHVRPDFLACYLWTAIHTISIWCPGTTNPSGSLSKPKQKIPWVVDINVEIWNYMTVNKSSIWQPGRKRNDPFLDQLESRFLTMCLAQAKDRCWKPSLTGADVCFLVFQRDRKQKSFAPDRKGKGWM